MCIQAKQSCRMCFICVYVATQLQLCYIIVSRLHRHRKLFRIGGGGLYKANLYGEKPLSDSES